MNENKPQWLSYTEAAARVKSDHRTVRRWHRNGMVMSWAADDAGRRYRVVELDALLAWWRQTMQNSPVHQNRLRRKRREQGLPPLEIPKRVTAQPERSAELPAADAGSSQQPEVKMPTVRASDEYDALSGALRHAEPGCRDVAAFTADRVDPEEIPTLSAICARCPVLEQCAVFAAAERPASGFWAGKTWSELREAARDAA